MVKRCFDLIASALLVLLLSPIMVAAAIAVLCSIGRPVIFNQLRPGRDGRLFIMHKFRTMTNSPGTDEERMTRIGKFLRAASIDELPELFDVLKGNMSLVGPRPLLPEYLGCYTERQARRHEVLPGITGWAQVNGRNSLSWEDKFELDVWYVDNQSFLLDIRILFLTIIKTLKREGISQAGEATMKPFRGSEPENGERRMA